MDPPRDATFREAFRANREAALWEFLSGIPGGGLIAIGNVVTGAMGPERNAERIMKQAGLATLAAGASLALLIGGVTLWPLLLAGANTLVQWGAAAADYSDAAKYEAAAGPFEAPKRSRDSSDAYLF